MVALEKIGTASKERNRIMVKGVCRPFKVLRACTRGRRGEKLTSRHGV